MKDFGGVLITKFAAIFAFVMALLVFTVTLSAAEEVVIYTSVDQVFSEPILQDFEKQTGIRVKALYDVEASKTVGLVNRLLAERQNPRCDVFWNSEVGRTIFLDQKGLFTPYQSPSARHIPSQFREKGAHWTGYAARARVLIYNTRLLKVSELPKSIFELTSPKWRGKVALAYPVFGTTATHMAALYSTIGQQRTEKFLKDLKENAVLIVDGNSVVRDLVVEGQVPIGFTDTDDANVAIQAGKPVAVLYPDQHGFGTLLIPNTVALIKGGPNPEEGKRLIDYLLSREVESRLAFSESAQIPVREGVERPAHVPSLSSVMAMDVDYFHIARNMERSDRFCQRLFVR